MAAEDRGSRTEADAGHWSAAHRDCDWDEDRPTRAEADRDAALDNQHTPRGGTPYRRPARIVDTEPDTLIADLEALVAAKHARP